MEWCGYLLLFLFSFLPWTERSPTTSIAELALSSRVEDLSSPAAASSEDLWSRITRFVAEEFQHGTFVTVRVSLIQLSPFPCVLSLSLCGLFCHRLALGFLCVCVSASILSLTSSL